MAAAPNSFDVFNESAAFGYGVIKRKFTGLPSLKRRDKIHWLTGLSKGAFALGFGYQPLRTISLVKIVVLLVGEVLIVNGIANVEALFLAAAGLLVPIVKALDNTQVTAVIDDAGFTV